MYRNLNKAYCKRLKKKGVLGGAQPLLLQLDKNGYSPHAWVEKPGLACCFSCPGPASPQAVLLSDSLLSTALEATGTGLGCNKDHLGCPSDTKCGCALGSRPR
jgi:hypothetical protein